MVNFATSKNLVKNLMFLYRNIHKCSWTSDEKTNNPIDHILIDRRWLSTVISMQSLRGAD
jgi:hypothetical protein